MLPYVLLFSLLYFVSLVTLFGDKKTYLFLSIFYVILLGVFTGLRFYSGADYGSYVDLFDSVPSVIDLKASDFSLFAFEWGYVLLNSFFKAFFSESYFFLFLLALFSISSKVYVASKFTERYLVAFFMYISFVYFNNEFIQIRWALAISFILYSFYCFLNGRIILSLLFSIASSFFHVTGALAFFVIFLTWLFLKRLSYKKFILIVLLSFMFSVFFDFIGILTLILSGLPGNYFLNKVLGYLNAVTEPVSTFVIVKYSFTYILVTSLLLLCMFKDNLRCKINSEINIFCLYSLFVSVSLMSIDFPILSERIYI